MSLFLWLRKGEKPELDALNRVQKIFSGDCRLEKSDGMWKGIIAACGDAELIMDGSQIIYSIQTGSGLKDEASSNSFLPSRLENREGLWVLVRINPEGSTVTLAQDRFRGMPLYTFIDETNFIASTQIKAIRAALPGRCRVSLERVAGLLVSLLPANFGERTLFEGINVLEPGKIHRFYLDGLESETTSYLSSLISQPVWVPRKRERLHKAALDVRRGIAEALRKHLGNKENLALALSGGVDSSILATALGDEGIDFRPFTATYPECMGEDPDESAMAFLTSERLKLNLSWVEIMGHDVLKMTDHMVLTHEEPLASPGLLVAWAFEKRIRDMGYRNLVTGLAGDTLFGDLPALWLGALLTKKPFKALSEQRKWNDVSLQVMLRGALNFFSSGTRHWMNTVRNERILKTRWLKITPEVPNWYSSKAPDYLSFSLHHETEEVLPSLLRWAVQRSRTLDSTIILPFIDTRLLATLSGTPTSYVLAEGYNKYLARLAYADSLPSEVIWNRRKLGFDVPLELWVNILWKDAMKESLLDSGELPEIVDRDWLMKSFDKLNPLHVWRLYVTSRFLEIFR